MATERVAADGADMVAADGADAIWILTKIVVETTDGRKLSTECSPGSKSSDLFPPSAAYACAPKIHAAGVGEMQPFEKRVQILIERHHDRPPTPRDRTDLLGRVRARPARGRCGAAVGGGRSASGSKGTPGVASPRSCAMYSAPIACAMRLRSKARRRAVSHSLQQVTQTLDITNPADVGFHSVTTPWRGPTGAAVLGPIKHRHKGNAAEGGYVIHEHTHERSIGHQHHFGPARVFQAREEVHVPHVPRPRSQTHLRPAASICGSPYPRNLWHRRRMGANFQKAPHHDPKPHLRPSAAICG